jgi:hypothetical protein
MQVYLACTVRGHRGALPIARLIADRLHHYGHDVLTTHLLVDDVDRAESALAERDVYERDIAWLDASGLLVAEASGSSYGVGFEVGYVLGRSAATGQRVVLLFDESRRAEVSRLIAGNAHPHCTTYAYRSREDLAQFIDRYLEGVAAGR